MTVVERWPHCDIKTHEEWPKRSQEDTVYYQSDTVYEKGSAADLSNAKQQFRFRTDNEWVELFDRAPHIMAQLLGDMYRETIAEREREAGNARIGRRPKAIDGSLDDLYEMITPRYSMESFSESARELIDKATSLRAFATRAGIHHHTITRMMRGEVALDRFRLEAIAKAGRVHPAFFKEYREMVILEALRVMLVRRPNVSIRIMKEFARTTGQMAAGTP